MPTARDTDRNGSPRTRGTRGTRGTRDESSPRTSRWEGALDAEMRAAAEMIAEWQRGAGYTQVELAERLQRFLPHTTKKQRSASNSTLSRWRDASRLRRATFETLRVLAEAAGHSMRDLVDRMETARLEYELREIGAPISVVEAIHARHQQEQELLADFRMLDAKEKRMLRAQAHGMALAHMEASAPESGPDEALSIAEMIAALPQPPDDPDEALARTLDELREIERSERERVLHEREHPIEERHA